MPDVTTPSAALSLDPTTWPADEVAEYLRRSAYIRDLSPASATSRRAMVLGSTQTFAQLAGRRALELGGSAVDAAIVTSLTQIALAAGAYVSYAGMTTILYWDATERRVSSLNAGFRSFVGETDPLTIPKKPEPSGRTAMVPGYFKGIEVAHRTHGRLPWADLFLPALFVAENGLEVQDTLADMFAAKRDVLARTPEGRALFCTPEGDVPQAGDVLLQPVLADTLRRVASQGSHYIYRGPWAERFVEIVNREGGQASTADLAAYDVGWGEPLRGHYGDAEICTSGAPDFGGATLIEGLHMAQVAGIDDPKASPEALFWLVQIARLSWLNVLLPPERRVTWQHAEETWKRMRDAGHAVGPDLLPSGSHSDFVVTADEAGNLVAMCHTINTSSWGSSGLFVDGISIPDAASYQQDTIAAAGPGGHVSNPMNPAIVLRDGTPVLACSSIGSGLMEATLQRVLAFVGRGAGVVEAATEPVFHGPAVLAGDTITSAGGDPGEPLDADADLTPAQQFARTAQVILDTFPADIVDGARGLGQRFVALGEDDTTIPRGYWGAIEIGADGLLTGVRTSFCNGSVEGL